LLDDHRGQHPGPVAIVTKLRKKLRVALALRVFDLRGGDRRRRHLWRRRSRAGRRPQGHHPQYAEPRLCSDEHSRILEGRRDRRRDHRGGRRRRGDRAPPEREHSTEPPVACDGAAQGGVPMIAGAARLARRWEFVLAVLIVVALAAGSALSPFFLTMDNLLSQTRDLMVIGFLALGLTPVVIMGDIDLSGEANLAVCAIVLGLLFEQHVNIWLASAAMIGLGAI